MKCPVDVRKVGALCAVDWALYDERVRALLEGNTIKLKRIDHSVLSLRAEGTMRLVWPTQLSSRHAAADRDRATVKVQQRENSGLNATDLVVRWNEEHRSEPVRVGIVEHANK